MSPSLFDVNNTLGAAFIGLALAFLYGYLIVDPHLPDLLMFSRARRFYGMLVTQVFAYYWRYPSDRVTLKILVRIFIIRSTDQPAVSTLRTFLCCRLRWCGTFLREEGCHVMPHIPEFRALQTFYQLLIGSGVYYYCIT